MLVASCGCSVHLFNCSDCCFDRRHLLGDTNDIDSVAINIIMIGTHIGAYIYSSTPLDLRESIHELQLPFSVACQCHLYQILCGGMQSGNGIPLPVIIIIFVKCIIKHSHLQTVTEPRTEFNVNRLLANNWKI